MKLHDERAERAGLSVAQPLAEFIETQALPGSGVAPGVFWSGLAAILETFAPENRRLLQRRDDLQAQIDAWHEANPGPVTNLVAYTAMLAQIGYLAPEPAPFQIAPENVDPEVAILAGPQLVVPVLNARFLLNAANARWGSLYDALYGTDALGDRPATGGYDPARGLRVVAWTRDFLDRAVPLVSGGWVQARGLAIVGGVLVVRGRHGPLVLADAGQLVGFTGEASDPRAVLLRHNGLHIEIVIDRDNPIGRADPAGIADVLLESALTTIVDLEDSVAAVDGADKTAAYANWLGLITGTLEADFEKGGVQIARRLADDRRYTGADGQPLMLAGGSLLFVRNVGHLMTTPAVRLPDGSDAFEGLLDAVVTTLCALHDFSGQGAVRNSRAGSIYIVKPKMHGPDEAAFCNRLFDAVEDLLGLKRHTLKVGLMDEERRTSANLAACIHAVRYRIVFINTGFLDRTGDEIHTARLAGPMIRKTEIKASGWISAYEQRNVAIGLACGFSGRAQIGKGMWAAPDLMADMLAQKSAHPQSGANTAWVPSPTAATLHAVHYHQIDVMARRQDPILSEVPSVQALLTPPVATGTGWSDADVQAEIENNVQGLLGYVVRWIDQGVGCSKVPDIHDVGLMEDRATLRISAQHLANWLHHGVCSRDDVCAAIDRMSVKVDAQNAGDPAYRPLTGENGRGLSRQAAEALVFEGMTQPNGYTEPLLHRFRQLAKARAETSSS
jgi:malate synthase